MWTEFTNYHWGWMGFGFIHMALIWGFFILAIFSMLQFLSSDDKLAAKQAVVGPIDALKLRYARGEINKQQFDQLKLEIRE